MNRQQRAHVEYYDNLMQVSKRLDQAQTELDRYRNQLSEESAQDLQAQIDRKRFDVELDLLVARAKLSKK